MTDSKAKFLANLIMLGIAVPFTFFVVVSCLNQYSKYQKREAENSDLQRNGERVIFYQSQGEDIILGVEERSGKYSHFEKKIAISKELYEAYLKDGEIKPEVVLKICKPKTEADNILGYYRVFDQGNDKPSKIKPITAPELKILEIMFKTYHPDAADLGQIKTSWLQRELNRNWVSANQEPQLG